MTSIPLRAGMTLGFSLIISLGPQNMFLIRQGLKREYAYLAALVCLLCDAFLIALSGTGLSHLILQFPILKNTLLIFGIVFLLVYGGRSLLSGYKNIKNQNKNLNLNETVISPSCTTLSIGGIIITGLSFSILNPQAIIDTVVLIGGVVNQYPIQSQHLFILGAITSSLIWFYGLTTLSRSFSRYLKNPILWNGLEIISGLVMVGFAVKLIFLAI